jgi:hypothetical protein
VLGSQVPTCAVPAFTYTLGMEYVNKLSDVRICTMDRSEMECVGLLKVLEIKKYCSLELDLINSEEDSTINRVCAVKNINGQEFSPCLK